MCQNTILKLSIVVLQRRPGPRKKSHHDHFKNFQWKSNDRKMTVPSNMVNHITITISVKLIKLDIFSKIVRPYYKLHLLKQSEGWINTCETKKLVDQHTICNYLQIQQFECVNLSFWRLWRAICYCFLKFKIEKLYHRLMKIFETDWHKLLQ